MELNHNHNRIDYVFCSTQAYINNAPSDIDIGDVSNVIGIPLYNTCGTRVEYKSMP